MTFVRYIIIQVAAYAIDMGVFLLVMELFVYGPILSNVVAKIAAGIFAFILHRKFTFEVSDEEPRAQAIKYSVLLGLNIPIASAALALLLLATSNAIAAKFIADVACVLLTYLLSKHLIFVGSQSEANGRVEP